MVPAKAGDFVHIACGTVHCFRNNGDTDARMLLIFSPGGFERFFEETLEPVSDRAATQPDNIDAVVARYVEAAPRHGLEFV